MFNFLENNYKRRQKNEKGFSLIELSIVLIIMGLLISGVVGSASLIETAKLRGTINDIISYRTAYNTYYAQFGKVPDSCSDDNGKICGYNAFSTLFQEGLINNESPVPKVNNKRAQILLFNTYLSTAGIGCTREGCSGSFPIPDFSNTNVLAIANDINLSSPSLTEKEVANIDEKIDDGKSTSGSTRGIYCPSGGGEWVIREYNEGEYEGSHNGIFRWSLFIKMDF